MEAVVQSCMQRGMALPEQGSEDTQHLCTEFPCWDAPPALYSTKGVSASPKDAGPWCHNAQTPFCLC